MIDGELLVRGADGREDFDLIGQRIHPAASRIERLSEETPAVFVAFDLLERDGESLLELPYGERRAALEALRLGPDRADADGPHGRGGRALAARGRGRDRQGVGRALPARRARRGWRRSSACARSTRSSWAGGPGKEEGTVGALILGLYEPDGRLREVGHSSGFTAKQKREMVAELAPYETGERGSAAPSRWTAGRDLEWVALRPELVVEITFDHTSRRADPPRREGPALARRQADPRECTRRPARQLSARPGAG